MTEELRPCCPTCGQPVSEHGTKWSYRNGCRCDLCVEAKRKYIREKRKRNHNDHNRNKRLNSESLATATNRGKQWTGPEVEIALRRDLTVRQIAQRLGRSIAGVTNVRAKFAAGDPRTVYLAGVDK